MASRRDCYAVRPTSAVSKKLKEITYNGRKESYSAYVSRVLADHFGLPHFELEEAEQEELPLANSA